MVLPEYMCAVCAVRVLLLGLHSIDLIPLKPGFACRWLSHRTTFCLPGAGAAMAARTAVSMVLTMMRPGRASLGGHTSLDQRV